jgi:hypothetical protein
VYTESQDGNMIRRNIVTGESRSIRPTPQNVSPAVPATERFRFHWDSPMMLSSHDPGVLIAAANRVFKSTDRGDSWTVISPDLTKNPNRDTIVTMGVKNTDIRIARNDGISQWPTIVALAESPKAAGVIYTGTDDGTVSVTRDGGATWTNITKNLPGFPAGAFVSEVVPSRFDAGTVYVTVDNHRENDYNTYVWMSTDYGRTFKSLRSPTCRPRGADAHRGHAQRRRALHRQRRRHLPLARPRHELAQVQRAQLPERARGRTHHPSARQRAARGLARPRRSGFSTTSPRSRSTRPRSVWPSAALFSVPTALQWKYKDDRNDEFWGHQTSSARIRRRRPPCRSS